MAKGNTSATSGKFSNNGLGEQNGANRLGDLRSWDFVRSAPCQPQNHPRAALELVLASEPQYTAICCKMVRSGMGVTLAYPIVV
jgi:hypothetical protein